MVEELYKINKKKKENWGSKTEKRKNKNAQKKTQKKENTTTKIKTGKREKKCIGRVEQETERKKTIGKDPR